MPASSNTKSIFKNLSKFDITAIILCVSGFFILLNILIKKFTFFGFNDWDLAFFTQAMWNLTQGELHGSLFDINFFSNHSNFIAYAILPLFYMAQHPLTLLIIKVFSFTFGSYFLYLIGKDIIGEKGALFILFLYFLYPPNLFALVYEFHFESFAPGLLMLSFYYFTKNRYFPFMITCIFLMLIKENMPLIVAGYGAYALITKSGARLKWGIIPIIMGGAYFYLTTSILIPYFGQKTTYGYTYYYKDLGSSPAGIALGILKHPIQTFTLIFRQENIDYLLNLFKAVCFLPLFRPLSLIIVGPIFLQHLLSDAPQMKTIYFHYAQTLAPFIFISLLYSLKQIRKILPVRISYYLIALIFVMTTCQIVQLQSLLKHRLGYKQDYLLPYRVNFLNQIKPKEGVIATFDYLAALSMRKEIYGFHKVYSSLYQDPSNSFSTPNSVTSSIIDFHDRFLIQSFWNTPKRTSERIQKFFTLDAWKLHDAAEHIIMFKKDANGIMKKGNFGNLIEKMNVDAVALNTITTLDGAIDLKALEGLPKIIKPNTTITLKLIWQALKDDSMIYSMDVQILKNNELYHQSKRHIIGYPIYPTLLWNKGEYLLERYHLVIPNLKSGDYQLRFRFYKHNPNIILATGEHHENPQYTRGDKLHEISAGIITIKGR